MDPGGYLRFLLALIFVLALIGVLAVLARRIGFGYPAAAARRSRDKRLSIVEVAPVDGRRRLVLVRRDSVEHLLLLGPNSETVVETNIEPPAASIEGVGAETDGGGRSGNREGPGAR